MFAMDGPCKAVRAVVRVLSSLRIMKKVITKAKAHNSKKRCTVAENLGVT